MENFIKEECVLLTDSKVFRDEQEHYYDIDCYDGLAIGKKCDDDDKNAPEVIVMQYPRLKDVQKSKKKSSHVLEYRGLYDLSASDINYGDVMMAYGEITSHSINH